MVPPRCTLHHSSGHMLSHSAGMHVVMGVYSSLTMLPAAPSGSFLVQGNWAEKAALASPEKKDLLQVLET